MNDYLLRILERKRKEIDRRARHARLRDNELLEAMLRAAQSDPSPRQRAEAALRRPPGAPLRVIAEVKRRSPSAGALRTWSPGDVSEIAAAYEAAGAAAVSVLCDSPDFGGTPLDLRRAARVLNVPLLFKEFVLDPIQVRLARDVRASMVLLLVRALSQAQLLNLVQSCLDMQLAPVVEAADEVELERALQTPAVIVGVNARDLRTFQVDAGRAHALIGRIPHDRIAVYMSGIERPEDYLAVAAGRADAVLIGGALMRAEDPAKRLEEIIGQA